MSNYAASYLSSVRARLRKFWLLTSEGPSVSGISRWGSRAKRRFLPTSKPTRRLADRLKGPTTTGPWLAPTLTSERPDAATPAGLRVSTFESSEEEEPGKESYFSPGCYVIDNTGLPREAGGSSGLQFPNCPVQKAKKPADDDKKDDALVLKFGVPFSVLRSQASRKSRQGLEERHSSDSVTARETSTRGKNLQSNVLSYDDAQHSNMQKGHALNQTLSTGRRAVSMNAAIKGLSRLDISETSKSSKSTFQRVCDIIIKNSRKEAQSGQESGAVGSETVGSPKKSQPAVPVLDSPSWLDASFPKEDWSACVEEEETAETGT